jgi:hypothetical protein
MHKRIFCDKFLIQNTNKAITGLNYRITNSKVVVAGVIRFLLEFTRINLLSDRLEVHIIQTPISHNKSKNSSNQ